MLVDPVDYKIFKGYCQRPREFNGNLVPCRKCQNCKKYREYTWKFRLEQETSQSSKTWFSTFTFRKAPTNDVIRSSWQKYMKRIRKVTQKPVRYFTVVEAGTRNGRLHLHSLLFSPANAQPHEQLTYRNIKNSWHDGFMHSKLVPANSDTPHIKYVCKYVTKAGRRIYASQKIGFPSQLPLPESEYPRWYVTQWLKTYKIPF